MTRQITFDLRPLKSEINETISFVESEKERLEKDVNRFTSIPEGKYGEQTIEKWRASLEERAIGLQKIEEILIHPLKILNGDIIARICNSIQSDQLQNEECVTHVHLILKQGQITNFFHP